MNEIYSAEEFFQNCSTYLQYRSLISFIYQRQLFSFFKISLKLYFYLFYLVACGSFVSSTILLYLTQVSSSFETTSSSLLDMLDLAQFSNQLDLHVPQLGFLLPQNFLMLISCC
ncbi:hypothetical protein CW304_16740 [Bacillus sp. UFRGS-B20]|nr:hypothetical protein CW304_16740 [Bacillus sp. UFRGS-B20]